MADQTRNREDESADRGTDETRGIYDEGGGRVEIFEHDEDADSAVGQERDNARDEEEPASER